MDTLYLSTTCQKRPGLGHVGTCTRGSNRGRRRSAKLTTLRTAIVMYLTLPCLGERCRMVSCRETTLLKVEYCGVSHRARRQSTTLTPSKTTILAPLRRGP